MKTPDVSTHTNSSEGHNRLSTRAKRVIGAVSAFAIAASVAGVAYFDRPSSTRSAKQTPAAEKLIPIAQLEREYGVFNPLGQSPSGRSELAMGETRKGNELFVSTDRGKLWASVVGHAVSAVWAPKGTKGTPDVFAATYETDVTQDSYSGNAGVFEVEPNGTARELGSSSAGVTDLGPLDVPHNTKKVPDYYWNVARQGDRTVYTFDTIQAVGWEGPNGKVEIGAMQDATVTARVPVAPTGHVTS
jgi:hypothetical protein